MTLSYWWTRTTDRVPLFHQGLLAVVFGSAAVGYSVLQRGGWHARSPQQTVGLAIVTALTLLLVFLQCDLADAYREHRQNSADRSSHRSLQDLSRLAAGSGAVQLGLALWMGLPIVLLLLVLWGGVILSVLAPWLTTPLWLNLLRRAMIMPLMALYATACDWLTAAASPPAGLIGFLLISLLSRLAIEIGHVIYPRTTSRLPLAGNSPQRFEIAWLAVLWLLAIVTLCAASALDRGLVALVLVLLLTGSTIVAWRFQAHPAVWAKRIEQMSALWMLLVCLSLGVVPLLVAR